MENAENTHQIPELENVTIQEENSSPVETTEILTETDLPTDQDQVTEEKSIEEFTPQLQHAEVETSVETTPDENTELISEIPAEEVQEKIPEEIQENIPEEIPEKAPEEIPEKIEEREPEEIRKEISPVEPPEIGTEVAEFLPETIVSTAEEHDEEVLSVTEPHEDITEPMEEELQIAAEDEARDTTIDYDKHTRDELVEMMQEAVNQEDLSSVKNQIALIKVAFLRKKKEDNLLRYEQFITGGGTKEDFAQEQDPLEERFNEIFNIYKANKARFTEEQEKIKQHNLKQKQEILEELKKTRLFRRNP
jgi:hypothetical protein